MPEAPPLRYADACAAAHALDLVGERWTLLVMREMMLGPRRFSDIKANLPGISANILTQRLERLVALGVACQIELPPPARVKAYELTAWGYASEPVFQALGRWGVLSPLHDKTQSFSTASFVMSLRTMIDGAALSALPHGFNVGFVVEGEAFLARFDPQEGFVIGHGAAEAAELCLQGAARSFAALIYGGVPLQALEAEGLVTAKGDTALIAPMRALFPLPESLPGFSGQARE